MQANKKSIIRLTQYRNILMRLKNMGFVKVFSDNLADAAGTVSTQVRKDFSLFNIAGNKRGGYQIDKLIEDLNAVLGKDTVQKVIVAGLGNIGRALINYHGFEQHGIQIVAGFDIDPARYDREAVIPRLPLEEMKGFVATTGVTVGILAVPDIAAQQVFDMMVNAGIRGVLNFAPIRLRSTGAIVVNNINLAVELENVIYFTLTALKGE